MTRPTDEERREIAENLRTMTMRGCRYKEEFYDLLNETVMNEWDFHSFSDVAERLADLIEPEPCFVPIANVALTEEQLCEMHKRLIEDMRANRFLAYRAEVRGE